MSSSDIESCDWESETRQSIGSQCEWSSDDSAWLISSTPAAKQPKITPKMCKPAIFPGFNNTVESCDWSPCELEGKDSLQYKSKPISPVSLPSITEISPTYSYSDGTSLHTVSPPTISDCPAAGSFLRGIRSTRKVTSPPAASSDFESPAQPIFSAGTYTGHHRRSPRKCKKRLSFSPSLVPKRPTFSDDRYTDTVARGHLRRSPRKFKKRLSFGTGNFYKATPSSINADTVTEIWSLFDVMATHGCAEDCVRCLHGLNEYDILSAHSRFAAKTPIEQRKWLFEYMATHCPNGELGLKEPKKVTYLLCGKSVCLPAWLAVLSISSSRFYEIRKEFLNGMIEPAPKKPRALAIKSHQAIAWMNNYFERIGDKRPDKDGIYLPTCLTEKAIYDRMVEDLQEDAVCFSQFNRIYRTTFPNVSIPKECRFTKCNFCTLVKNELCRSSTSKQDKNKLRELLDQHLQLQEQERKRYYSNRQKAIESPDEVISLILDGMDQNKTNLPSFVRVTKSCQNLWCLRTHLTGCLVHGIGAFNYFDFSQWPHDCNLTLCTLLETLLKVAAHQPLAHRLFVQMDNCVRENKNKYVMGFCALLVEAGIFTEIELGFLMVGHTHEDIDQTFSCLSRYLRKHDALTMPEMEACCKAANHTVREAATLTHIFDIKTWLSPYLEEIHGHTTPHVFLFRRNAEGKAVMFTKLWSHEEWEPQEGVRLLKEFPSGLPDLAVPNLTKIDLPQLERDAVKYSAAGVLTQEAISWWNDFLQSFPKAYGSIPSSLPMWYLDKLKLIRSGCQPPRPPSPHVPEKILSMHKSQTEQHTKVTVGKRAKASKKTSSTQRTLPATEKYLTPVEDIEKEQNPMKIGSMVALRLHKYEDEIPQIGKVVEVAELDVTVEWWVGTYHSTWIEWKERGQVIQETFPQNAILRNKVSFTKSRRLTQTCVTELKHAYTLHELM